MSATDKTNQDLAWRDWRNFCKTQRERKCRGQGQIIETRREETAESRERGKGP